MPLPIRVRGKGVTFSSVNFMYFANFVITFADTFTRLSPSSWSSLFVNIADMFLVKVESLNSGFNSIILPGVNCGFWDFEAKKGT